MNVCLTVYISLSGSHEFAARCVGMYEGIQACMQICSPIVDKATPFLKVGKYLFCLISYSMFQ